MLLLNSNFKLLLFISISFFSSISTAFNFNLGNKSLEFLRCSDIDTKKVTLSLEAKPVNSGELFIKLDSHYTLENQYNDFGNFLNNTNTRKVVIEKGKKSNEIVITQTDSPYAVLITAKSNQGEFVDFNYDKFCNQLVPENLSTPEECNIETRIALAFNEVGIQAIQTLLTGGDLPKDFFSEAPINLNTNRDYMYPKHQDYSLYARPWHEFEGIKRFNDYKHYPNFEPSEMENGYHQNIIQLHNQFKSVCMTSHISKRYTDKDAKKWWEDQVDKEYHPDSKIGKTKRLNNGDLEYTNHSGYKFNNAKMFFTYRKISQEELQTERKSRDENDAQATLESIATVTSTTTLVTIFTTLFTTFFLHPFHIVKKRIGF